MWLVKNFRSTNTLNTDCKSVWCTFSLRPFGNKAKGQISKWRLQENKAHRIFWKTDIFYLPHDTQSFFTLHLTLHDEGPYHIKTSPLICSTNQWAGFYMIGASVMKNLNTLKNLNQAFFFKQKYFTRLGKKRVGLI